MSHGHLAAASALPGVLTACTRRNPRCLAVGETVIVLTPLSIPIETTTKERGGVQQNDSLADGYRCRPPAPSGRATAPRVDRSVPVTAPTTAPPTPATAPNPAAVAGAVKWRWSAAKWRWLALAGGNMALVGGNMALVGVGRR